MASVNNTSTARSGERITANDSTDIQPTRAINVAGSGLVYVDFVDAGSNVPVYISAGSAFPAAVTRIYSTGTTATGITVLR